MTKTHISKLWLATIFGVKITALADLIHLYQFTSRLNSMYMYYTDFQENSSKKNIGTKDRHIFRILILGAISNQNQKKRD